MVAPINDLLPTIHAYDFTYPYIIMVEKMETFLTYTVQGYPYKELSLVYSST